MREQQGVIARAFRLFPIMLREQVAGFFVRQLPLRRLGRQTGR